MQKGDPPTVAVVVTISLTNHFQYANLIRESRYKSVFVHRVGQNHSYSYTVAYSQTSRVRNSAASGYTERIGVGAGSWYSLYREGSSPPGRQEWAHCLPSFDNSFGSGNKASGSHHWCDSDGNIRSVKIIHNINYEFIVSVTFPPYSKLTLLIDISHRCYDLALAVSPTRDPNPTTSRPPSPLSPVTKTKQKAGYSL